MKRPFVSVMLLCLFVLPLPVLCSDEPQMPVLFFEPEVFLQESDYVDIQICINFAVDVYAYQITVKFPPFWEFLKIVDVNEGDFFDPFDAFFVYKESLYDNFIGEVTFACTLLGVDSGVDGNGLLATISFAVIKSGDYNLTFAESKLLNSALVPVDHAVGSCFTFSHGNVPTASWSAPYNRVEVVTTSSPFGLDVIPARYGLDEVILNYIGEMTWKLELLNNYTDILYEERATGYVEVTDVFGNFLGEFRFVRKIEFFDAGRNACIRTATGYDVDFDSPNLETLKYELNIKKLYDFEL